MRYYAVVGSSAQVVSEVDNPIAPDGYIEMNQERPSSLHIATSDGTWTLLCVDEEIKNDKQESS